MRIGVRVEGIGRSFGVGRVARLRDRIAKLREARQGERRRQFGAEQLSDNAGLPARRRPNQTGNR